MKKLFVGICFSLTATLVYANCTTHTLMQGGRFVTCTTCCYGGNCNTTCY